MPSRVVVTLASLLSACAGPSQCPDDMYTPVGEPIADPSECPDGTAFFCEVGVCDGPAGGVTCEDTARVEAFLEEECRGCSVYEEGAVLYVNCFEA